MRREPTRARIVVDMGQNGPFVICNMKTIIGVLLLIVGVAAGIYFGVVWAFIGGIVSVIQQLRADHIDVTALTLGIARIVFAGAIGWLSGLLFIIPGYAVIVSKK